MAGGAAGLKKYLQIVFLCTGDGAGDQAPSAASSAAPFRVCVCVYLTLASVSEVLTQVLCPCVCVCLFVSDRKDESKLNRLVDNSSVSL